MVEVGGERAGTVTVLFTDLVESTALRQSLGDDRADEVRREHDQLVRDVTNESGGTVVKSLGDGFMLVFGAAAGAVGAAVALQRAVERFSRRAPGAVRIRVGASAGDVVWEGDDCFGTPVVEASRLCDAADAGQILVSDVVRVLAGSRGSHRFRTCGTLELRGLVEPLGVSEVAWEPEADDATVPLPGALSSRSDVRFVGRTPERERLSAAWKDAASGNRRVALVSGEPGVGKTRLAAEIARIGRDDGATVLYGRCDEDLGVPYQPFVEALQPYIAAAAVDELAEQVAPYGGDLARLVPQLADRLPGLPDALNADPETERYRLFDALLSFLGRVATTTPVVLILDDLHWAAKPTLLLLRHLTRADWLGPLLIVCTYRDTDLSRTHPLADMLADLRRQVDVERIVLHGLDAHEVEEFLVAAGGHALDDEGAELARMLHTETEGNPFFMGQVLRHLVESGAIVERDGRWVGGVAVEDLGIPEGVREVVGRRLAHLQRTTNDVLTVAAVVGRDFDRDVLTTALDGDAEAVLDALEEAEAARLIGVADSRRGRYTFVHALVRSTLYEEIPTTRRLRLHKRIGEALEARDIDDHLDELAHHFAEAAALGESDKAVDYGRRAARRALERLAYEEAAIDYERAIASLDPARREDRTARTELLIELGRALWMAGERGRCRERLAEAVELARAVQRPDLLAEAAITSGGVRGWIEAGVVDELLVQRLEEALIELPPGDSRLRAMVTVRLGSELTFRFADAERRRALTGEALAIARRLGDPAALAYVLTAAHWGMFAPGNVGERLEVARELLGVAEGLGDRNFEAAGLSWLVTDLVESGDIPSARAAVEREGVLADELRQPELRWAALAHQGAFAVFEGRLDDAERLADDALAVGQQAEIETAAQMFGVQQIALRRLRGGLDELVPLVAGLVEQYPLIPAWRSGLAYVCRELGMVDEARTQLEVLAADDFATLPFDTNWLVGAAILAAVCELVGDKERAAALYKQFAPYEDTVIHAGLPADILGSAHHFLMLLAGTMERWDHFERHAREALARNEALGSRPWLATTQLEVAKVLARRAQPGDAQRARGLLDACLASCDEIGMPALSARARDVLA